MTRDADPKADSGPDAEGADSKPLLKVVNADATPEEIAALVAVFASLGAVETPPRRHTPEWQAHHRKVRARHAPGPLGWRSSGLPR
jgi:hypothetical protein